MTIMNTTTPHATTPSLYDFPIRDVIQDASNVVMIILSSLAIVENVVVVGVLYQYPVLHTTSNKILANVAASDLFTSIIGVVLHSFMWLKRPVLDVSSFGIIDKFLRRLCVGISTFTMAFVACDGWMHVDVKLPRYRIYTRVIYVVITACWLVPGAVFLSCLPFAYMTEYEHVDDIIFVFDVILVVVFILPYIVLATASMRQYLRLRKKHDVRGLLRGQKRGGMASLLVVTVYFVMNGPVLLANMLSRCSEVVSLFGDHTYCFEVYALTDSLMMANPVVTPLLYFVLTPLLRRYCFVFARMVTVGYEDRVDDMDTGVYSLYRD